MITKKISVVCCYMIVYHNIINVALDEENTGYVLFWSFVLLEHLIYVPLLYDN